MAPASENKERHFCFVYFGNQMHLPDFDRLHFNLVEGCWFEEGGRTVQFVRVSLQQKNGRRAGTIPRIIDEYNRMDGRSEPVQPVVYFPLFNAAAVVCFKSSASIQNNPILTRIAAAKRAVDGFWRWCPTSTTTTPSVSAGRRFISSMHDVLREIRLPESRVSVQRVYSELSEPYFKKFGTPLAEGTGCIPIEHREFIVSEIRRLFEEELSYTQQPSTRVLPQALIDHNGWMGDILLTDAQMNVLGGGSFIRNLRVENLTARRRRFMKTGTEPSSLRAFLVFYALKWNDAGLESVCYPVKELHSGWIQAVVDFTSLMALVVDMPPCVLVQENKLRVASVDKLLKLLCDENLIAPVESSVPMPTLNRMTVQGQCAPPKPFIVEFLRKMIRGGWDDTVEITALDVIKVLNGGDVGTYRQSCVREFLKPFISDGSIEGFTWMEGAIQREKYVVHVARVALRLE
jgi:hypothetical protein